MQAYISMHWGRYKTWTLDWTGLDWTGLDAKLDWKTDVISLQEWAWLVTKVLLLAIGCLVSTRSRAENKLCRRVNTPGKTRHEAAVRLHML